MSVIVNKDTKIILFDTLDYFTGSFDSFSLKGITLGSSLLLDHDDFRLFSLLYHGCLDYRIATKWYTANRRLSHFLDGRLCALNKSSLLLH